MILDQELEMVPTDKIRPHPDNPRRGDTKRIRQSIKANGFYGSCVVQRSTGNILVGNHRYRAAVDEGLTEIPVTWVDVSDDQALKMLLVDNRVSDFGAYDDEELMRALEQLDAELEGSGYDTKFFDDLAAKIRSDDIDVDNVDIGKTPEERLESWEASGVRSIVLPYDVDTYDTVREQFAGARKSLELESNAEVVQHLLTKLEA